MAKKLGENYRFQIGDGASPEGFTELAGQRTLNSSGDSQLIDTSSKTTGRYRTQAAGRINRSFNVGGQLEIPDASGIEAARVKAFADPFLPVNCRIVDNTTSPDTVVFLGSMYITNWSETMDDEAGALYSFVATLADTPSVDDLSP